MKKIILFFTILVVCNSCLAGNRFNELPIGKAFNAVIGDSCTSDAAQYLLYLLDGLPDDSVAYLQNTNGYKKNIRRLLNGSYNQKMTAYGLLGRLHDSTFNDTLLNRLQHWGDSEQPYTLPYAVMDLYPMQTDKMFQFILRYETFGDAFLMPKYLQAMNTEMVIQTSLKYLHDTSRIARLSSLQILALKDPRIGVDSILIDALHKWQMSEKGYVIVAFEERKNIPLKNLFTPYINDTNLHATIIEALYKSPFPNDTAYAREKSTPEELEYHQLMKR